MNVRESGGAKVVLCVLGEWVGCVWITNIVLNIYKKSAILFEPDCALVLNLKKSRIKPQLGSACRDGGGLIRLKGGRMMCSEL